MAKKIKLQIKAGMANPAPPVGPVLSQAKVNIQAFCSQFNEATKDQMGKVIPVEIYVEDGGVFTFKLKQSPAANLIMDKIKIPKGSGVPNKEKVGTITWAQLKEIAAVKMEDLNANDIEAAAKILAGTARSMGVKVA